MINSKAITKGKYQYKVTFNHAWDTSYPSSNAELNIPTTGTYDVTFTFDPSTKEVKAEVEEVGTHTYTIAGDKAITGYAWNETQTANDLTKGTDGTYSLAKTGLSLAANTAYGYKVVVDHAWTVNYPFTEKNETLTVTEAGTYDVTFTFNSTTKVVSATATKEPSVNISDAGFATLYSDKALDFTGTNVKAYTAKVNGIYIDLTEVTKVPANTGLVLKAAQGTYSIPTTTTADAVSGNDLIGSITATDVIPDATNTYYALKKIDTGQAGFAKITAKVTIPAGKAYIKVTTSPANAAFLSFEDAVTGIDNAAISFPVTSDATIYNMLGMKVTNPSKGLYIQNGKTIIIK